MSGPYLMSILLQDCCDLLSDLMVACLLHVNPNSSLASGVHHYKCLIFLIEMCPCSKHVFSVQDAVCCTLSNQADDIATIYVGNSRHTYMLTAQVCTFERPVVPLMTSPSCRPPKAALLPSRIFSTTIRPFCSAWTNTESAAMKHLKLARWVHSI